MSRLTPSTPPPRPRSTHTRSRSDICYTPTPNMTSTPSNSSPAYPPTPYDRYMHSPHHLSRSTKTSNGHGLHLRCSPDCTASDPPYRMLAKMISWASRINLHGTPPLRAPVRPSLQTRRSGVPITQPLTFDTTQWATPPPPLRTRDETSGDYFDFLPRSSSAPSVSAIPPHTHGRKNSITSDTTDEHPLTFSVPIRDPPKSGIQLGRFATVHGKPERLGINPHRLSDYLGPELAAALKQRFDNDEAPKAKEVLSEADWSFEVPLAKAMQGVLARLMDYTPGNHCQIAEYGCSYDTPKTTTLTLAKSFSRPSTTTSLHHVCPITFDSRPLQSALSTLPLLTSFSYSKFGAIAFPPQTIDIALGGNNLSKLHGHKSTTTHGLPAGKPVSPEERERLADQNLTQWLSSRSQEVKQGGMVCFHFAIRGAQTHNSPTEAAGLPNSPEHYRARPDIWQAMYSALGPAIQRLVSLGEVKTYIAPMLVDVPFWPRTLRCVGKSLKRAERDWDVVKDDDDGNGIGTGWSGLGVRVHRLVHPAWTEYLDGRLDRAGYARRVATYCRSVYEGHIKKILRERGKMDVGQAESTVGELFKILVEKCESGSLDALEMDIGIVILKRK